MFGFYIELGMRNKMMVYVCFRSSKKNSLMFCWFWKDCWRNPVCQIITYFWMLNGDVKYAANGKNEYLGRK